ncbi:hypothetical protein Btru_063047 [Bulinus truncatus]|nr:hypothetical protein Btru_063047 [Bulinus truncatus]
MPYSMPQTDYVRPHTTSDTRPLPKLCTHTYTQVPGVTLDPCAMKDVQTFSYLGRCFQLVSDSRLPWGDAQSYCQSNFYNGSLAEPKTASLMNRTLEFVTKFQNQTPVDVWIGANDIVTEGTFVWASNNSTMSRTLWPLDPCYLVSPNSYYGLGQCLNYSDTQLTWEDAKEFCLNISSYLAEPETFEMYQLVSDYVGNKPAWLGAKHTADQEIFSWVVSQNAVNSTFGTGPFNSRLWIQGRTMYGNGSIEETRGFVCQTAAVAPNPQTYVAVLPNLYKLTSRQMNLVVTSNFTSIMYLKFQFLHSKQTKFTTRSPLTPDGAVTYPVNELIQTGNIDHVFVEINATQPVTVVQYITDQSLDQASATLLYPAPVDSSDNPMMTSYLLLSTLPDNNDTTFILTSLFNDSTEVTLLFEVENLSRVVFLGDKPVEISQVDNITTSLDSQYESFQMKMKEKLNGSYLYSTLPVKVLLTTTTNESDSTLDELLPLSYIGKEYFIFAPHLPYLKHQRTVVKFQSLYDWTHIKSISYENKSIFIQNATTSHEMSLESGELNKLVGNESFIAYLFFSGFSGKHQHVCVTTLLPSSLWRDEYQFFKADDKFTLTVYVIVDVNMTRDIEVNGDKEQWQCDIITGTSYSGCNKTLPKSITHLRLQLANRQGPFGAYVVGSTKRSTFCNPLGIRDDVNTSFDHDVYRMLLQDKHSRLFYDDNCKMYPCKVTTSVKFQAVSGVTSDVSWITAVNISKKIPKLQTREELVKFLKVENRNLSSFRREGKTFDPCLDKNEPAATLLFGKCVQLVTDLNLTWFNAQGYCQSNFYNGTLAEPLTDSDMNATIEFVMNRTHPRLTNWIFRGRLWIGANDIAQEGRFVWASDNSTMNSTLWNKGEPNNFLRWSNTVPNVTLYDEDCVEIDLINNNLNDVYCSQRYIFACQMESCYSIFPGSVYGHGQCFKYFDQILTWDEAREFCLMNDSHLVEPETTEIKQLLVNYLGQKSAWLGANNNNDHGLFRWMVSENVVDSTIKLTTGDAERGSLLWSPTPSSSSSSQWSSHSGQESHGFVCQTGRVTQK